MRLYLVQHGQSLPKEIDPDRPLSEQGRAEVEKIAALLAQGGVEPSRIVHSGKTRAHQTAAILADKLMPGQAVEAAVGLAPNDPVEPWIAQIGHWKDTAMLVGHLPFMGKLVSRLVAGNEGVATVAFQPGTVVCLEQEGEGGWAVAWMIRPELL